MIRTLVILLLATTATAAWAGSPAVALEGAWLRAMPPGQPNTAGYLTLRNTGEQPLLLTGGSCPLAQRVEVHISREVDGYMRMERLEQVAIAPGEQLQLQPGGMHLMLLGLQAPLVPDTEVPLCLEFQGGAEVCGSAAVRRPGAESADTHHHGHH